MFRCRRQGFGSSSLTFCEFCAALSLLLALSSSIVLAQSASAKGMISGTVTDQQGNAVAGAQVTIRSADFTSTRTLVTNDSGIFTAAMLNPGAYTIEVKAPGFSFEEAGARDARRGQQCAITIRLGVAGVSQNVTVTGHGPTVEGNTLPPAVNKETPQVSNTLAGLTVTYLPNRDRDFSQFGQLAAGVQPLPTRPG